MKKCFLVFAIFSLVFSVGLMAQFNSVKLINAGVSFGLYGKYYHDFESSTLNKHIGLPFFLQYEKGIGDKIDLEEYGQYITMGAFLGYQTQLFDKVYSVSSASSYEVYRKYQSLWGGMVGSFHAVGLANKYLEFSIPAETWDIYLSLKAGLVYQHYTSNYETDPTDMQVQLGNIKDKKDYVYIYLAPVIGARYYFLEHVSAFTEIGRANFGTFHLGLSVKI